MAKPKRAKRMPACRCDMCGGKNAGKKNVNSYWRAGLRKDEHHAGNQKRKKQHRKLRRLREKSNWKNEGE